MASMVENSVAAALDLLNIVTISCGQTIEKRTNYSQVKTLLLSVTVSNSSTIEEDVCDKCMYCSTEYYKTMSETLAGGSAVLEWPRNA